MDVWILHKIMTQNSKLGNLIYRNLKYPVFACFRVPANWLWSIVRINYVILAWLTFVQPENLIYSNDDVLKISDFGLAKHLTTSASTMSTACGTPGYVGTCFTVTVVYMLWFHQQFLVSAGFSSSCACNWCQNYIFCVCYHPLTVVNF